MTTSARRTHRSARPASNTIPTPDTHPAACRSSRPRGLWLVLAAILVTGAAVLVPLAATAASAGVPTRHTSFSVNLKWANLFGTNSAVALSSPNYAYLDSTTVPSVIVGSRQTGCLYAYDLSSGATPAGWPVCTGNAIDSTISAIPDGTGHDDVLVTSGSNFGYNPGSGTIREYGPAGNLIWSRGLADAYSSYGAYPQIPASPAVGDTGTGAQRIVVGGVSGSSYSLDPATGSTIGGWPIQTPDSTFATAAIANINGVQQVILGGDSSKINFGGVQYIQGGTTRLVTARGAVGWAFPSNEVVTSSPAVGNLSGSGPIAVFGHGTPFWNGSDGDGVTALNAVNGGLLWENHTGGYTRGSPALADLSGNGQLDVVATSAYAMGSSVGGTVVAYGPTGNTLWGPESVPSLGSGDTITGGAVTADFGEGYQDVVVATSYGWDILDGKSGAVVATQGELINTAPGQSFGGDGNGTATLQMENSPLVIPDPSGGLDVVVAGTFFAGSQNDVTQGFMAVYQVSGSPNTVGTSAWPQFHHDQQLTGSAIPAAPLPGSCNPDVPPCSTQGYWEVASDGGLFAFGNAPFHGSMGGTPLNAPVVGMAKDPATGGYWEVASDGGIFAFGAPFYGSMGGHPLNAPIVGIASTADGLGYWEVASDGGLFAFGDAGFYGSMGGHPLNKPVVGITTDAATGGYREVASDGGIFSFNAPFYGSMGGAPLNAAITTAATDPATGGYWEVGSDGGIFAFNAPFHGSMGGSALNAPIVGMAPLADGSGYWEVGSDGGVFSFGAYFRGGTGNLVLNQPIVGVASNG